MTPDKLIAEVRKHTGVQGCTIARKDGTACDHIAIIVNRGGYSVRPSFKDDASDVLGEASSELGEVAGMAYGSRVSQDGGNGTIAAARPISLH